jgi:ABC-2 type transport system permease protein
VDNDRNNLYNFSSRRKEDVKMTVFLTATKRIFKSKLNLIFMLIMPIALIFFTMMASFESQMFIGVVDDDKTKLSQSIVKSLQEKGKIVQLQSDEIRPYIIDMNADYILHIEKGFTEGIIKDKNPQIRSYSIKESNNSATIKMFLNSYINAAKNIAKASEGEEAKFYKGLESYENGSFSAHYSSIGVKEDTREKTGVAMGFVMMGILFFSSFAPMIILKDKQNKTYYRIFTTPVSVRSYMLQNILSLLVVSIIQVGALLGLMKLVFKADLGPSIPTLFFILMLFALVSISLGIFISSISKDMRQASSLGSLISTPLLMLGGCYWPMEFMPQLLQNIAKFLPTTWALKAARDVVYGARLGTLGLEIGILVLFMAVFFLMGSWRKTDIAK